MPFTACFDSLRPKKNMQTAPMAGNSGINQMWSRKNMYELSAVSYQPSVKSLNSRVPHPFASFAKGWETTRGCSASLPFQQIHFVHVHRLLVAEEGDDDAEADCGFGGRIGDDEDGEHLPVHPPQPRERHQVQVHGIQDQLNRHQDDDHVAPRQHPDGADDEQRRRNYEVMHGGDLCHTLTLGLRTLGLTRLLSEAVDKQTVRPHFYRDRGPHRTDAHRYPATVRWLQFELALCHAASVQILFFAITTAPTMATSSSSDAISNGSM